MRWAVWVLLVTGCTDVYMSRESTSGEQCTCSDAGAPGVVGSGDASGGATAVSTGGSAGIVATTTGGAAGEQAGQVECPNVPTCTDGTKNDEEQGVDCGGPCAACPDDSLCQNHGLNCGGDCAPCAENWGCWNHNDCLSRNCDRSISVTLGNGLCKPATCSDGIRNGNESGVDCGGGGVCPACAAGQTCYWSSDCLSGTCNGGALHPAPRVGNCQ
jgi:hypothetical protein